LWNRCFRAAQSILVRGDFKELAMCSRQLAFALLACLALPAFAAPRPPIPFAADAIVATAAQVEAGGELRLQAPLGREAAIDILVLRRHDVWADDAQIVVHSPAGDVRQPIPSVRHFLGKIEGEPRSRAFLSVLGSGEIRGIVTTGGRYWVLGHDGNRAAAPLMLREIDAQVEFADKVARHRCDVDRLNHGMGHPAGGMSAAEDLLAGVLGRDGTMPALETVQLETGKLERGGLPKYAARIALETDQEFLAQFAGSTSAAMDYVADLMAYNSGVYGDEVDTSLVVTYLSLWTTADPWIQSDSVCGLLEFGKYWNDNRDGVSRTLAHFLSGKSAGGGVAWLDVLCGDEFDYDATSSACAGGLQGKDNYGGSYGFSGDLEGDFNPAKASIVWDLMVTAHELGHNFGSQHTHCYNGGGSEAIDPCYSGECAGGCYCGTQSLPAGCPGPGQGCGTIMSYCHLRAGGVSNVSMTFGAGHPYGVQPERVKQRIEGAVIQANALNPGCLAPGIAARIFSSGFESGDTSEWSATTP
jgi:hypothetical protein